VINARAGSGIITRGSSEKNMNRHKSLVFFGAHPDDESFGLGATLAQYAASGVRTYYVCSTGGEAGTVEPRYLEGYDSIKELRAHEMECAARVLGLARVYHLGYRDSGMPGSADNERPGSLVRAPVDEVTEKMVRIIREIQPDVVITHDDSGSYGHPDHIATNRAAVRAYYAGGDPEQYPDAGIAFQPGKLYFGIRPHKLMKMMIRLMPLFGQDPHHFGRNKDVDLTKIAEMEYPIHAVIRLNKGSVETRNQAVACHASQSSGPGRSGLFRFMEMMSRIRGPRDYFFRLHPPPNSNRKEKDLFEGIL
jgi:N-acetyl-1-D-myo-inositol-2-amino-2-deoxy-alpha-D-glucopyranoside deacetylase